LQTYISGGTDCKTGMIGLLKYLCLNILLKKENWIPESTLDLGFDCTSEAIILQNIVH